jgi:hypothetical protein
MGNITSSIVSCISFVILFRRTPSFERRGHCPLSLWCSLSLMVDPWPMRLNHWKGGASLVYIKILRDVYSVSRYSKLRWRIRGEHVLFQCHVNVRIRLFSRSRDDRGGERPNVDICFQVYEEWPSFGDDIPYNTIWSTYCFYQGTLWVRVKGLAVLGRPFFPSSTAAI